MADAKREELKDAIGKFDKDFSNVREKILAIAREIHVVQAKWRKAGGRRGDGKPLTLYLNRLWAIWVPLKTQYNLIRAADEAEKTDNVEKTRDKGGPVRQVAPTIDGLSPVYGWKPTRATTLGFALSAGAVVLIAIGLVSLSAVAIWIANVKIRQKEIDRLNAEAERIGTLIRSMIAAGYTRAEAREIATGIPGGGGLIDRVRGFFANLGPGAKTIVPLLLLAGGGFLVYRYWQKTKGRK